MGIKKTTLAALVGVMVSGSVLANSAPDSGTTDIEFSVVDGNTGGGLLMLKHLDGKLDLGTFGTANPSPSAGTDFCIYASGVAAGDTFDVNLEASGSAGSGAGAITGFEILSGVNRVPYTVDIFSSSDGSGPSIDYPPAGGVKPITGLKKTALDGNSDCVANAQGGAVARNAYVKVSVAPGDASVAPVGDYKGRLILTVSAI